MSFFNLNKKRQESNLSKGSVHAKEQTKAILYPSCLDRYVVLDLETTGLSPQKEQIIEIAMIKIAEGKQVDEYHTLLNPCCHISSFITRLTGISNQDVEGSPTIRDVLQEIDKFLNGFLIVGHNVTFDLSFLQAAYQNTWGEECLFYYLDTLSVSRAVFPNLPKHKLEFLIEQFELADEQTHRALDDVICTQKLLERCISDSGFSDHCIRIKSKGEATCGTFCGSVIPNQVTSKENICDKIHPFYGKSIVFTGNFTVPKQVLIHKALNVGALVKTAVSSKTDYLVVGMQNMNLVDDRGMSTKEEKAHELVADGKADIEFLSELAFYRVAERWRIECVNR